MSLSDMIDIAKIASNKSDKDMNVENDDERAYLDLLRKVMETGIAKNDRTGVGTKSLFGEKLEFDITDTIPLLTTKRVFYKTVIKELLFFLSGKSDNRILQEQGVKIWNGNSSREYLDSINQTHRQEGDLGYFYGVNWRHFGVEYKDCNTDYTDKGYDQIADIVDKLRNDRNSRRIILSAWNPPKLAEACLPPCHILAQWWVDNDNGLYCQLYQRSADLFLGVPFNIASYSILTHMLAAITGLKPKKFIHVIGDCHIYNNHLEQVKKQLTRSTFKFPILKYNRAIGEEIKEIDDFKFTDFEIINYKCHSYIKAPMAV